MKDRNLLPECNGQKLMPEEDFRQLFCARCRNQECVFSEGGENRWVNRMSTQEERFLKNPLFADPDDPRFADIRALHFEEALQQAYQMELSAQRGDWTIPEVVGPREEATKKVDAAVQRLAESQGKQPPEFPDPKPEEPPPDPQPVEPKPEPRPQPKPESRPTPQQRRPLNTEMPPQGLMVDGTDPIPPSPVQKVATESWEIPAEQKVAVGGKVVLGPSGGGK
jgi:outer membrane biosynthesis protein TonB